MKNTLYSLETLTVHALGRISEPYRDLVPPIHMASTFERAADGSYPGGHLYSRLSSPAYDQIEEILCQLEEGRKALLFGSGMAAGSAILQALKHGDRIVVPRSMYWGLRNWIISFSSHWGLDLAFYNNSDLDDLERQVKSKPTRLLWIETPANPTWEVTDIRRASDIAHRYGALVVVDSTVSTPIHTRPLLLGADIVMHSATKYLNGHSDVIAGALITREDNAFWQSIHHVRSHSGAVLGPLEAWLLLRGMRTLHIRVRAASANALHIAQVMATHPEISQVLYPGLPTHQGHQVAVEQMKNGFGGMLSLRFAKGEQKARDVAARIQIFKRATSLGSVESLIEHRASIEGAGTVCPDDLLRLSIGIEPVEDLIADLQQAIES